MKNRNGNWIWILLLFTLALILRLVLLRYRLCIETDGVAYVAAARDLIQHGTMGENLCPPLYRALIGLTSLLVGDYELSGRIVSAMAGSLLVIPMFLLGERLYSRRVGYLAATLVVFYPMLVEYSTTVQLESPYIFFLNCFFLTTLVAFKNQRWPFFVIGGVLLGLSYLIRPEALGYLPYLLLVYIGTCFFARKDIRKTTVFINAMAFAASALCLMIPYMVFVGGMSEKTVGNLIRAEAVGHRDFNRARDEFIERQDSHPPSSLVNEIAHHPLKMIKRAVMNIHLVHKYSLPELFPPLLLCLVTVGLLRVRRRWEELLMLFLWVPYGAVLFFVVEARLFLPLVPIVLILAARGVEWLQDTVANRIAGRWSKVAGVVILAIVLASLLPYTFRPLYRPDENITFRMAGMWLREHYPDRSLKIMARTPYAVFYAGADWLMLPIGKWPEVLQYARSQNATHLVVDNRAIMEVRPELISLLSPDSAPAELRLAGEFSAPGAERVLVYEFR